MSIGGSEWTTPLMRDQMREHANGLSVIPPGGCSSDTVGRLGSGDRDVPRECIGMSSIVSLSVWYRYCYNV